MNPTVDLIYIAGYGRSGSTFLDIVLGASPDVYGAGAMSNLFKWGAEGHACSCGQGVTDCDFWGGILHDMRIRQEDCARLEKLCRAVEKRRWLQGKMTPAMRDEYRVLQQQLLAKVAEKTQQAGARYILDSSKSSKASFYRPALLMEAGCNVKLIHLSRDGRGVLWSVLKKLGSPEWTKREAPRLVRAIRAIMGWNVANQQAFTLKKQLPAANYLHLTYEALVTDPDTAIAKLGGFLGIETGELQAVLHGEQGVSAVHNIGGNRLRFEKNIRLKPDFEWQTKLPWYYRPLFWVLSLPMMWRLGYLA
jgi:hypothetical protein